MVHIVYIHTCISTWYSLYPPTVNLHSRVLLHNKYFYFRTPQNCPSVSMMIFSNNIMIIIWDTTKWPTIKQFSIILCSSTIVWFRFWAEQEMYWFYSNVCDFIYFFLHCFFFFFINNLLFYQKSYFEQKMTRYFFTFKR